MNALITGICGQDGAHLSELLLKQDYCVFGIDMQPDLWRLRELGIEDRVNILSADITDLSSLLRALEKSEADELYHLASQSFVGTSFDHPIAAALVTGVGTLNVLEAVRLSNPKCRVYNAATSELYGDGASSPQSELTPMKPSSPYATAKLFAFETTRLYREAYGLYSCSGILFNHEGELRGEEFVTRKISVAAARAKLGWPGKLKLGNLNAQRDWGYAREYVEAMQLMLQQSCPEDYVCATGETHAVWEFCAEAYSQLGLDWQQHVITDERLMRPSDVSSLCGNATKLATKLMWAPATHFRDLVRIMVQSDLDRMEQGVYVTRPRQEMIV